MAIKLVGIFVGSLRKESFNRKIANYLLTVVPNGYEFKWMTFDDLPFYNEDLEANDTPISYVKFREEVKLLDAALFITPEYNRSVPAVLKNAIDVASRPYGKNVWNGKPAGIISSSIGAISGFGANHHLRQSLVFVNMPTMAQPEAYLGNVSELFDKDGKLINEDTKKFLQEYLKAFTEWVEKFA